MHDVINQLSLRRLAVITFLLSFAILYALVKINVVSYSLLHNQLEKALQPIVALSVSLIIFPFITIPSVESIVSRAERAGIKVSKKLVEDYIHGCYTVFSLSLIEIISIIFFIFFSTWIIIYLILSFFITKMVVLLILVYSLWQVSVLLQQTLE